MSESLPGYDRWLSGYQSHPAEAWCDNPECHVHREPIRVTYETENGQGWVTPEDCPECRKGTLTLTKPTRQVLAFLNHGEYRFVAESRDEFHERVGEEIGGDQCDTCGSFGLDGEPGPGFIVVYDEKGGVLQMRCGCCDDVRPITWQKESVTVF